MDESTPSSECAECGSPLEASGLCARCLMAGAAVPTEPAGNAEGPDLERVAAAFPQFEILELIGRGGMGSVVKVRQPKLNRFAALKLLPHSLAEDPAFAGRFEREAQVLARLSHPNIVAVYDFGQADGFFYLLMEFVDGVNLRQAMQAARFTPEQALGIVPKICEALQFAHDEGILHRDIKPENLLLDSRGRVKLADFGIAKLAAEAEVAGEEKGAEHPLLTQAGAALGTPSYMAPEQRESPSEVDHRADIYSLGVVFYELLTGELPQQVFTAPSAKSEADPRVDGIVRQALENDRNLRQRSAGQMKTQVETLGALSPEQKGGLKVAGSFSAVAAIALSMAGTWEEGRVDPPKSSAGVPVTVTTIGVGEPWLIEQRWMSAQAPDEPLKMVGGIHAAPSPWLFSEVAMILAGLCWMIWFLVKRRCGERLDSKLDENSGKPSFVSVANLWIGALGLSQWLSFSVLGLLMFFRQEWDLPIPLEFIFKINFLVSALWVFQGFARRRFGEEHEKGALPGPWPARLVGLHCLLVLAAFGYGAVRSAKPSKQVIPTASPVAAETYTGIQGDPFGNEAETETTDVHLELIEKTSVVDREEAREVRQVAVISEKPGFLHLWHEGGDPLVVPMHPEASGKGFRRDIVYSLAKAERPVLHYQVITKNTEEKSGRRIDLANHHLTFDEVAEGMRAIADPVGKCLRRRPLDLIHVGDGALLMAVTDTDGPLRPPRWKLHIWHATLPDIPARLPAGLASVEVGIGKMLITPGEPPVRSDQLGNADGEMTLEVFERFPNLNDGVTPEGQRLGRISQRDGVITADLIYAFEKTLSQYQGEMTPEVPLQPRGGHFSYQSPVRMVLSRRPVLPFLVEQVKLDERKRKP